MNGFADFNYFNSSIWIIIDGTILFSNTGTMITSRTCMCMVPQIKPDKGTPAKLSKSPALSNVTLVGH